MRGPVRAREKFEDRTALSDGRGADRRRPSKRFGEPSLPDLARWRENAARCLQNGRGFSNTEWAEWALSEVTDDWTRVPQAELERDGAIGGECQNSLRDYWAQFLPADAA